MIENTNSPTSKVAVITGTIGSGKSTVCQILESLGAKIVYADQLAKEALNNTAINQIVETFGSEVVVENKINREKLAELIFKNPEKKKQLENLIHPIVREKSNLLFKKYIKEGQKVIVYECPLFFESGLDPKDYKEVILVNTDEKEGINRASIRDNLSKDKIKLRSSAQMLNTEKVDLCTYILDNNKGNEELKIEVEKLFNKLII